MPSIVRWCLRLVSSALTVDAEVSFYEVCDFRLLLPFSVSSVERRPATFLDRVDDAFPDFVDVLVAAFVAAFADAFAPDFAADVEPDFAPGAADDCSSASWPIGVDITAPVRVTTTI